MNNKDIANGAVTGLVGLVVAPIIVGVVAKSVGKCVFQVTNVVKHIKKTNKNKKVSVEEENVIDFNERYNKMWNR